MHTRRHSDSLDDLPRASELKRNAALLRATTELFVLDTDHDRDEIARYEELALYFLPKVPVDDRIYVAEALAARRDAPHALIKALARDVIEAASAVIRHSALLEPIDLLSVIASTGPEHHRLIACRNPLPADVRRALAATGDAIVLARLDGASSGDEGRNERAARMPPTGYAAPRGFDRVDPWRFLGFDRRARLAIIADLSARPPQLADGAASSSADLAFQSILSAARIAGFARSGQFPAIVVAVAEGLSLPEDLVAAAVNDPGGELLAIMLKALRLDNTQARQVFLLATPSGTDVRTFFPLSDLYSGLEISVAEALVAGWRGPAADRRPQHQPHLADNSEIRRQAAPETRRPDQSQDQARRA